MSDKFQDKFRIPSARAEWWDYSSNGAYFVTICTRGREHYFGEIGNGKMKLSGIGILADVFWYEIKNHSIHIKFEAYVVMPNHIHGILILNRDDDDIHGGVSVGTRVGDVETRYGDVETRHALSLQPIPQPIPQPSVQPTPKPFVQPSQQSEEHSIAQKRFQNQGKNTISSIVGSYKSAVTKHAHRLGFEFSWQSRFYDHIIRDEVEYEQICQYIKTNPLNWKDDQFNQ